MNRGSGLAVGALVAVLAAGGGYWIGQRGASHDSAGATVGGAERKILFYRNPMGLPDTSTVPKKDPMGMDYIPVYEGEQEAEPSSANQIRISSEKVQKLGVRTELAQLQTLDKLVRAAGRVEPDERRLYTISPKFEGYVERLHVSITGQPVGKGQPLFEVYSPELVSAQREYAVAAQGVESLKGAGDQAQASMRQLADSSLLRLRNWDISDEQIKALAKSEEARRTLTFRSPVSGIVIEKKAVQGMRFMPGEALYQIADLSSVWVIADVFEQDIGLVKTGAKALVHINAYPDKRFEGTISYVYPTLQADTRTVQVRIELANPGQLLKPGMYAQVELPVGGRSKVVVIPNSAVIDSGTRRIVLVQAGEGRFEPREVRLGQRSDNQVEVLDGIKEGEAVVVTANFLIDAESNLKAAVGSFGHASHGAAPPASQGEATSSGAKPTTVGHQAEGAVEEIDLKMGAVTLNHGAIASLKWPAMSMEFQTANPALLSSIRVGMAVKFEFVERKAGEWVITRITPQQPANSGSATNPHAGH